MSKQTTVIGVDAADLHAALQERFSPAHLEVIDESYQHEGHAGANGTGFGTHFRVRIQFQCEQPSQFAQASKVARHRLVYDCLQPFFEKGLHALAIEA